MIDCPSHNIQVSQPPWEIQQFLPLWEEKRQEIQSLSPTEMGIGVVMQHPNPETSESGHSAHATLNILQATKVNKKVCLENLLAGNSY